MMYAADTGSPAMVEPMTKFGLEMHTFLKPFPTHTGTTKQSPDTNARLMAFSKSPRMKLRAAAAICRALSDSPDTVISAPQHARFVSVSATEPSTENDSDCLGQSATFCVLLPFWALLFDTFLATSSRAVSMPSMNSIYSPS